MTTSVLTEKELSVINVRSSIARFVVMARNSKLESLIDVYEEFGNIVGACHSDVRDDANRLCHRYKSKLFTIIQYKKLEIMKGEKCGAVKSREMLMAVDRRGKEA